MPESSSTNQIPTMPRDILGFSFPNQVSTEVKAYEGWDREYYHVSNPPRIVREKKSYKPWQPTLKQYIRLAVDKNLKEKKGAREDKIGAWALKNAIPIHLIKCEGSGVWFDASRSWSVIGAGGKAQRWHYGHVDDNAIQCRHTSIYYTKDCGLKFTEVVEIGQVMYLYLQHYFQWEDGTWHQRRENEHKAVQEEAKKSGTIADYHSVRAPWRVTRNTDSKILYGVELELKAKNMSTGRRKVCDEAEAQGFLGETDGSLCSYSGIEVIAPPMEYSTITGPESPWRKFLEKTKDKIHDSPSGYGMHVSVSRAGMSQFHQVKFMLFFHRNKPLSVKIAGRESNYALFYPDYKTSRSILSEGRSAAGPNGDHRIEVRIFQSVSTEKCFLKNVEFTAAAVDFTRQTSVKNLTEPAFMEWLGKGKRGQYPNLCDSLIGKREPDKDWLKGQKRLKLKVKSSAK